MADQPAARQPGRAPKRQRKNRVSQRRRPKDQGPILGEDLRYPEAERTMMVQAVMAALTPREAVLVRLTGDFPNNARNRLNAAYRKARRLIHLYRKVAAEARAQVAQQDGNAAMDAEDIPEHVAGDDGGDSDVQADEDVGDDAAAAADDPEAELAVQDQLDLIWLAAIQEQPDDDGDESQPEPDVQPTHDAIKRACKTWTKRFLTDGHVHDIPPCQKGAKTLKHWVVLAQVHQKIMQGWTDVDGRAHAYFGLDDLERRDRRVFAADAAKPPDQRKLTDQKPYHELKASMGIKHNRYMWGHLKARFPHLRRLKHRVRRARKDREGVMVCSRISVVLQMAWHDSWLPRVPLATT